MFLSDLTNHSLLATRFVEVIDLDPVGGRVRVRGPGGLHQTAVTRMERTRGPLARLAQIAAEEPSALGGRRAGA